MQRTIYHGSSQVIRTPRFGSGAAGNDYGLGFYCTEDPSLAGEWAVSRGRNGFINRFTIETGGLRIINLNSPQYCILHWLSVLLNHREFDSVSSSVYQAREYIRSVFSVDYQNCDCMVGFRSDNSNFLFAQTFLNGDISYRQLNDAVRMNDTGRQFVLKSNRAFDRILFYGYTVAHNEEYCPAMYSRDSRAMERFASLTAGSPADGRADELYAGQIVSERIQPYDPRLRI